MKFIKWVIYFFTGISFIILLFIVLDTFIEGIKLFRYYPVNDFIFGGEMASLKKYCGDLPFYIIYSVYWIDSCPNISPNIHLCVSCTSILCQKQQ